MSFRIKTAAWTLALAFALALLIEGCGGGGGGGDKPKPPPAPVPEKVKVEILIEAGSTASQLFMVTALKHVIKNRTDIADLVNLSMYSFGNAYYETEEQICGTPDLKSYSWGSWPGYNDSYRKCWEQKCGRESVVPEDACFVSGPYCEHGASECAVNLLEMCAKQDQLGFVGYVEFAICLSRKYPKILESVKSGTEPNMTFLSAVVEGCADRSGLDAHRILQCFATVENLPLMAETARQMVEHTEIPWVTVTNKTGVPMVYSGDLPTNEFLKDAVCRAWEFNGGDLSVVKGCNKKLEIAI